MKKSIFLVFAILTIGLALCVTAFAGDIGFRAHEVTSVSDSGFAWLNFKPNIKTVSTGSALKNASLPAKYDAREQGVVTSIKDQGEYGSCWAFSAISCAESSLISEYPKRYSAETTDFSEVQHAYFAYSSAPDPMNMTEDTTEIVRENFLNIGGNPYFSTASFAKWFGVSDENSVVTYEEATPDTVIENKKAYGENAAVLENAYWLDGSDISGIKKMVMKYGSVSVSCYFDPYLYYNYDTNALYCPITQVGNHQVTIIGWDDSFSNKDFGRTALSRPSKNGAWLIKNSYGPGEGEDGCFWLSYYDKTIVQDIACAYDFQPVDTYQHNYQYDGSVSVGEFFNNSKIYGSNVFKAKGTEKLQAISFFSVDNSATYKYQIYLNPTKASVPSSGTPVYASYQSCSAPYAGYVTIKLPEEIQLKKGDSFAVVIRSSVSSGAATVVSDYDGYVESTRSIRANSTVRKGQSFVSTDGKTWDDATKISGGNNLRIKAFTTDGSVRPKTIKAAGLFVVKGAKKTITVETAPAFASKSMSFSSSDTSIATVSSSGVVTGKTYGKVYITIKSKVSDAKTKIAVKVIPAAPSSFKEASAKTGSVTLKWSAVSGAEGYQVYMLKNGEKVRLKTLAKTTFTVSKLKAGTKYTFYVRAYVKKDGTAFYSSMKMLKAVTAPAVPTVKLSKTSSSRGTLSWNKVTGATEYVVYKYNASKKAYVKLKTVKTNKLALTGLKKNNAFRVKAVISYGGVKYSSAWSNKVVFK